MVLLVQVNEGEVEVDEVQYTFFIDEHYHDLQLLM